MIPNKLRIPEINFVLLEKNGKKPFQEKWQVKKIGFNDSELITHLNNGGNYGIMGGGDKNLLIIDFDDVNVQNEIINKLPETFTVRTGRGMLHKYFFSNKKESFKIFDEEMNTLLDVQGEGKQVVGVGSIHPNGNKYELLEDKEITFIDYAELQALIKPYDKKPRKERKIFDKPIEHNYDNFLDVVKSKINIIDVLNSFGIDTKRNPTTCFLHDSKGGKCLSFNNEVAHCFHCQIDNEGWNIFSMVKDFKKCDFKEALDFLVELGKLEKEYEENKKKYLEKIKENSINEKTKLKLDFLDLIKKEKTSLASELLVKYILKNNYLYTIKNDNKSEMWIYKEGIYIPHGKSEIKLIMREILGEWFNIYYYNLVLNKIEPDTFIEQDLFFNTNYINELPIQNGILNIFTRELIPFTPEKIFFGKLPVIYDKYTTCPNIDKFLSDVLANDEDKKVFFEIIGSALVKEYTYEKAFMFVGNGRNGKGKSLELIKRLFGIENCISIPLVSLTSDSFLIGELFGKFVNLAGDIGNKDLQDTSMFKALTGRDTVTGKRKFLLSITFISYAKMLFACNELPTVYDTSKGFWERWVLLEYPYTFVSQQDYDKSSDKTWLKIRDEDILNKIINQTELSGLLNMALDGLDRLQLSHNFSVTKGSKDVKDLWIRKANSFMAFVMDNIEEDYDCEISKKDMRKKYTEYCKKHGLRSKSDFVIKKVLSEEFGATDDSNYNVFNKREWVWRGIRWKK